MRLALWEQLASLLRLARCPPGARLALHSFGDVLQAQRSSSDRDPACSRRERFFLVPSLDGRLLLLAGHSFLPKPASPFKFFPFFVNCGFGFWRFQSFLHRDGLMYPAIVKASHITFCGHVIVHVFALLCRMLRC